MMLRWYYEYVAGDERLFAHLMNKKAFLLGASQTHFENSSGLPSREHLSTVYDLALLGRYALTIPEIAELVKSRQIKFRHPSYREPLILNNTNTLLESYPGANGIKTGTTNAAGKCLVASAQRDGRQLIAVTLQRLTVRCAVANCDHDSTDYNSRKKLSRYSFSWGPGGQ